MAEKADVLFRSDNFKKGLFSIVACLIVFLIAFASPYWLQVYHSIPYEFKNMGLWQVCFSKYFFREDRFATEYAGCYWNFAIELDFRREIFNPGFFMMVQVLSVIVLFLMLMCTMIIGLMFLNCTATHKWTYWLLSLLLGAIMTVNAILLFIIIVTVGAKSGDRKWLPRADLIWLSWGYAFAVLATIFAIVGAVFFGKEAKLYWGVKAPDRMLFGIPLYRQGDAGMDPPTDSGSVF